MRILQILLASLLFLAASGIASAVSLVVRDVLQAEPDARDSED
jgi:hypothetical protein